MSSRTNQKPPASPAPQLGQSIASPLPVPSLHSWLGFTPSSARLQSNLSLVDPTLSLQSASDNQVKAYSDSVYFNLYSAGLSLVFEPQSKAYKPRTGCALSELDLGKLRLASIDIYNHTATLAHPSENTPSRSNSLTPSYGPYPLYPIPISYVPTAEEGASIAGPGIFHLNPDTKGRELVEALGEPDRKGGGEGSMGIWVEWTSVGLMVEFASGGLQAWDQGGEAVWKCASFFERGVQVGRDEDDQDVAM